VWWYTQVIPALKRLRQADLEFKASLCCIVRLSKKKKWYVLYAGDRGSLYFLNWKKIQWEQLCDRL
jgi:hypothetical protein